jgi:hypothetical protein
VRGKASWASEVEELAADPAKKVAPADVEVGRGDGDSFEPGGSTGLVTRWEGVVIELGRPSTVSEPTMARATTPAAIIGHARRCNSGN